MFELYKQEFMAFYRFGDLFLMERIPEKRWIDFIIGNFEDSGKSLSKELVM